MKWKATCMLAVLGSLVGPTAARACDMALGYLHMSPTVQRFALTGAAQLQPGRNGGDTYLIPSVDVAFPLGTRAVVRPMVGLCTGGGESDFVFGAGGAYNVWNNPAGTFGLNLQTALTRAGFEGGSDLIIPLSLAGLWQASATGGVFFGAGIQVDRYSYSVSGFSSSGTESDPFATVGGQYTSGRTGFQAGLVMRKGNYDTDVAVNAAVTISD